MALRKSVCRTDSSAMAVQTMNCPMTESISANTLSGWRRVRRDLSQAIQSGAVPFQFLEQVSL